MNVFRPRPLTLAIHALLVTSLSAHAATRCDALPEKVISGVETRKVPGAIFEAQCRTLAGLVVRSGTTVPGGVLQFVDGWRGECEIFRNNKGTGEGKGVSVCSPGAKWFKGSDGVAACQWPDKTETVNRYATPRMDCLAAMQFTITGYNPTEITLPPVRTTSEFANATPVPRAFGISVQGKDVDATATITATFKPLWFDDNPIPIVVRLFDRPERPVEISCGGNCQNIFLVPPTNLPDGTIRVDLIPPAPAKGTSFNVKVNGSERSFSGGMACNPPGQMPREKPVGSGEFKVRKGLHSKAIEVMATITAPLAQPNSVGEWSACPGVGLPRTAQYLEIQRLDRANANVKIPAWFPANNSRQALLPKASEPVTLEPGLYAITPVQNPQAGAFPTGYMLTITFKE